LPKPGATTLQRDDDFPPKDHARPALFAGDGDGDGESRSGKYAETDLGNCVKEEEEAAAAVVMVEEERGFAERRRLVTVLVADPERCTCA
jgi:hypothetical protein